MAMYAVPTCGSPVGDGATLSRTGRDDGLFVDGAADIVMVASA
jgi:hypothetical protein